MSKGEVVSKAYRAIVSDAKVLPYSPEGLSFLRSKRPSPKPGSPPWTPVTLDQMDEELIRSSSKGTSCGVNNFPIDILIKQSSKTLVKKEFPVNTRTFLELLTAFFNRVFTFDHCSPGVLHFYDAGEQIRLLQGATISGIPQDRRRCPAVTGLAGEIRRHSVLWGVLQDRADAECDQRSPQWQPPPLLQLL
jgi:hypothetical protein